MMNRIKIVDLLTGKKVWAHFKKYEQTQWYSPEEMRTLQVDKLKKLLHHCYKNVPYYTRIIDEQKIDITGFSTTEVLQQFPVLTKEIIQANYELLTPLNNRAIPGVKTKMTAGTTGNTLFYRNDHYTRSSSWATYHRFEQWMGIGPRDRALILMGGHLRKESFVQQIRSGVSKWFSTSSFVNIYDTSPETLGKIIAMLRSGRYSYLRSYPQFLYSLAMKLDEQGLVIPVKAITTTAEPVRDYHRELFRKVFQTEVFDQYGCGEIGAIAYECNHHKGMHISDERVIVETNDNNEIIVTDLDNYTMPFIRYMNADQVLMSSNACSCGRTSKLITQIMGRTCDYTTGIDGQFVHWAYYMHLLFDLEIPANRHLRKMQVVQQSADELLIRLVADPLTDEEMDLIATDIRKRMGPVAIRFSIEKDIENTPSGKFRPIVNNLIQPKTASAENEKG